MGGGLLFTLLALYSTAATTATLPQVRQIIRPVPDGVLVAGGEITRGHTAMWTILVTSDVQTFDHDFSANLTTFLTYLNRHHAYRGIDNQTAAIWEERILVIQNAMKDYAI